MSRYAIAKVVADPANPGSQNVTISAQTIALLVALIGTVPPLTTAVVNWAVAKTTTSSLEQVQRADAELKHAQAAAQIFDTEVKRRQSEAEWVKVAVALEDAGQRKIALEFLLKSGLVSDPDKK